VARVSATVDDVLRLADQGRRYELVDGELVEMAPTSYTHGRIEYHVGRRIGDHVQARDLGEVVVGEVLFQLAPGRVARAADVAFIRRERPRRRTRAGAFKGAPDLAVEIVSPGNSAAELDRKVADCLPHGTRAVLVMYPNGRYVVLWRPSGAIRLGPDGILDLDPIIAGFRCPVRDLFPTELASDDETADSAEADSDEGDGQA
jgi:Uma2 family endonuclease